MRRFRRQQGRLLGRQGMVGQEGSMNLPNFLCCPDQLLLTEKSAKHIDKVVY
jgi:hypothetical protein